ncbi:MAG: hypothetical protein WBB07_07440 [Mycobacterium sp.]
MASATVAVLRLAAAAVFTGWLDGGTAHFVSRGLDPEATRELTVVLVSTLDGAFILARTLRSTDPLVVAGRALALAYRSVMLTPPPVAVTPGG